MSNKNQLIRRLLALLVILTLCCGLAGAQLFQLQVVNGDTYVRKAAASLTTTSSVSASRGEILDRYGRPLITNKSAFSIVLLYSQWKQEGQNERLLALAELVQQDGGAVEDILPVTDSEPFDYIGLPTDDERKELTAYISERAALSENPLSVDTSATAPALIEALRGYYQMPDSFTAQQVRTVAGLRYSMKRVGFSLKTSYTLARDVSINLIAIIKEHHKDYAGVEIESEAVRQYNTTSAAHILGTVGPIYESEWEDTYQALGYNMNDTVGKSGIEKALESYLHGSNGSRAVTTELGGDTVSEQTSLYAPQPGDSCVLTIDLALQQVAEQSLAEYVGGYGNGGAAVVIDVNSGEVLAMASYPTYDLAEYNKDYNEILDDSRKPLNNRATSGLYAPGSTYKILTAVAGLEEGVITDANWTQVCTGQYTFFDDYQPYCSNRDGHGPMTVTTAIKYSCNVFFFEVGRQLTGEKLEQWAKQFGLGEYTDVEVAESKGQAAGPTSRAKMLENNPYLNPWSGGDPIQAAIGQSDNLFTPLQLANYIAAVVNGGTLYRPTLIKTVKTYDYADVVKEEKPEVLNSIPMSATTLDLVKQGMGEVTEEGGTAATVFADYPIKIGGKTGTAETNVEGSDNGVFVAFAPFDNPEVALCVVGEGVGHGSSVAPVVRDILDAYFTSDEAEVTTVEPENTLIY